MPLDQVNSHDRDIESNGTNASSSSPPALSSSEKDRTKGGNGGSRGGTVASGGELHEGVSVGPPLPPAVVMAEGGAIGIPMAQAVQMGESDAGMRGGGGGGGGGAGMAMGGGAEGRFPPQRIDDLALPEVRGEGGRVDAAFFFRLRVVALVCGPRYRDVLIVSV